MKKYLLLIHFIMFYLIGVSQISEGGKPRSFDEYKTGIITKSIEFVSPYNEDIISEDVNDKFYYRIGIAIPVAIDFFEEASLEILPDGGKLFSLMIVSSGAKALGLYYDSFSLSEGSDLFIYSEDKTQIIGRFNSKNNPGKNIFATEPLHGDRLILEYYQPEKASSQSSISISEISYIYRGYEYPSTKDVSNYGDSDYCEVNVNCSPEGDNWQDEKRGVAKILLKEGSNYFWCSGSLVNNVRQDFEPYFLTADHCGHSSSTSDYLQWIFYFNFETAGCSNPTSTPSSNTMVGCSKVASGGNSGSTGSDFKLLLFNSNMPSAYNPYYNGWDRQSSASTSGVGIHHPVGDVKKISVYTSTLLTASWSGPYNAHWLVYWASTLNGHGVTEGGSSGSPLFNSEGLVVGQLTGGGSYCSTPNSPDLYGKFSYSWESNGTFPAERLKDWLDPDNTGATSISGTNQQVSISGLNSDYCIDDLPDTLSGIPSGGTFSGTGISGNIFSPAQAGAGTFTITYSTTSGNTNMQVTVHPLPIIDLGPDLQLPSGQSANIDAGSGYSIYIWSEGSTTQIISISQPGSYWVEVTNNSGCSSSDTIVVDIVSFPGPGWTFTNTGSNHSILFQGTTPVLINGFQIEPGDYIGVFYDSLGALSCAGYMVWTGNSEALAAWGTQAGLNDGFAMGEEFKYKIWDLSEDIEYSAIATYITTGFPNQQYYSTNGMSGIASINTITTVSQSINLNQGWGIFSTYIDPVQPSMDSVFSSIINEVIIVKDGNGSVFWPPFLNMIGNLTIGQGYQTNLWSASILNIEGSAVSPEVTSINVPAGWSIIGYLRQSSGNAETMLSSLSGKILIVKDGSGQVYWPPFVNLIGDLVPGQGYQINLNSSGTLIYPAN